MTNYKGKFIEWCTTNNKDYQLELTEITGYDHSPSFCYELLVDGCDPIFSDYCSTKKRAQHNVCKKFLDKNPAVTEDNYPADSHYYIDLENCADIRLSSFKDGQYESFASIGSVPKVRNRATMVTRCTRSDAADIALIAKLTEDIVMQRYSKYAIISRDKLLLTAAEVLGDLYNIEVNVIIV